MVGAQESELHASKEQPNAVSSTAESGAMSCFRHSISLIGEVNIALEPSASRRRQQHCKTKESSRTQ